MGRPENCQTQKFASRIFFWGNPFCLQSKKLWPRLTEEIARLGFAPVLSAELQMI